MFFMQEIKAQIRTEVGRGITSLRKIGVMPAVLYGEGIPSQSISISRKEFEKVYKEAGESTLVKLELSGKPYNVLIYDVANDPLKDSPIHADFYAVRMDRVLRTKVTLVFVGESPAVKNDGGVLVKVIQEVEVEALPQDLPHELKADLSNLDVFESRLLIKDINIPSGVKILTDLNDVIAIVEPPRKEEELTTEVPVPSGPIEVKTEKEIKKEEKKAKEAVETSSNTETK